MSSTTIDVQELDSAALLGELSKGSSEAWAGIVASMSEPIRRCTWQVCGDPDLCEDATQEALLQIRDGAKRFTAPLNGDPEAAARAWMLRIARCSALEIVRRRHRRHRREQRYASQLEQARRAQQGDAHSDELACLAPLLREELAGLPDGQRQALVLRYMDGKDYRQIARELGCSTGAARVRAHRGIERLRSRLAQFGLSLAPLAIGHGLASAASIPLPATAAVGSKATYLALLGAGHQPALKATLIYGGLTTMTKIGIGFASIATAALLGAGAANAGGSEGDGLDLLGPVAEEERHDEAVEAQADPERRVLKGIVAERGHRTLVLQDRDKERHRLLLPHPEENAELAGKLHDLRPGAAIATGVEDSHLIGFELLKNGPERGRSGGVIIEINKDRGAVALITPEGKRVYSPHWRGGHPHAGGGLDPMTIKQVREFDEGDAVVIDWVWQERLRIEGIRAASRTDERKLREIAEAWEREREEAERHEDDGHGRPWEKPGKHRHGDRHPDRHPDRHGEGEGDHHHDEKQGEGSLHDFSGLVRAQVLVTTDERVVVKVLAIKKLWRNNRAHHPEALVEEKLSVGPRREEGRPSERHLRFIRKLKEGMEITLELQYRADWGGWFIPELNQEQREWIEE